MMQRTYEVNNVDVKACRDEGVGILRNMMDARKCCGLYWGRYFQRMGASRLHKNVSTVEYDLYTRSAQVPRTDYSGLTLTR